MFRVVNSNSLRGNKTFLFWQNGKLVERAYRESNFNGLGYPATFETKELADYAVMRHYYGFCDDVIKFQLQNGFWTCFEAVPL